MRKESKKDWIAQAALTCFLSSGYSNTSMDEIAKAAGISKGGLYWHFKSKEEIFYYIAHLWIDKFNEEFLNRIGKDETAATKLEKFMLLNLEKAETPLTAVIFDFFFQHHNDKDIIQCILKDLPDKRYGVVRDIIREAIENGEFKKGNVEAIAEFFVRMVEGVAAQWALFRDKELLELNLHTTLDIFFNGVLNKN